MTPNPLVYIYSGLLSRFVLLVKVLGSLVILGGLLVELPSLRAVGFVLWNR